MTSVINKSLKQIAADLEKRVYSCHELTVEYLSQIDNRDKNIGAFLYVNREQCIENAKYADLLREKGIHPSPFAGIPIAIKDNISVKDLQTTCGSRILEGYKSPYDATVVAKLKQAGFGIIGKTNMDEFGMGSSGERSAFFKTANPIDTSLTPGGSSSGSAAAVCANQAPIALGSDTGGSVRLPASFCGLVGIKPTYGNLSRFGLVSFAPSLDQIGVISKNVEDNALVMNICQGHDAMDSTSIIGERPDCTTRLDLPLDGMKVAVVKEDYLDRVDEDIAAALFKAAKSLEELGCKIVYCSLPDKKRLTSCYCILSCAEASSNLARYDGVRLGRRASQYGNIEDLYEISRSEGFGSEVKQRIMLGSFVLSSGMIDKYYYSAIAEKQAITSHYLSILEECDAILTPTYNTPPFKLGENRAIRDNFENDLFTVGANLSGLPSLTIPVGKDRNGLPIGLSLMGKYLDEPLLYQLGKILEGEKYDQ